MIEIDILEAQRLKIQSLIESKKSQEERNKAGQFATPTKLAIDILKYAKSFLSEQPTLRFLDPAFGTGSFFSALLREFPGDKIIEATGYEIDPLYHQKAIELWQDTDLQLHFADFTSVLPPSIESKKANLLICNPPYVRHHHLTKTEKQRLVELGNQATGIKLSEQTGLYGHFLFSAHNWLAENGLAGWLIPAEFMDVNYGQKIKEYLLTKVTLLHIHSFDPKDMQFQDALVSSSIVWFKKSLPPDNHTVLFTKGGTLTTPQIHKNISKRELSSIKKWTRVFSTAHKQEVVDSEFEKHLYKYSLKISTASSTLTMSHKPILSDLFHIKRGIATGANNFFILSQEEVMRYQLPKDILTPILPNPRFLAEDEVLADLHGDPLLKEHLFLLTCDLAEDEVKIKYPSLWKYLQIGIQKGVNKGYLCNSRKLWYSQEKRPASTFLCAYMGRQKAGEDRPFRFIINHSKATASNAYHNLYPNIFLQQVFENTPEMIHIIGQALQAISSEILINEGRVYGGGLHKMEPKELANVPADMVFSKLKNYQVFLPISENTTTQKEKVVNQNLWTS